jgi:hypothetical protein
MTRQKNELENYRTGELQNWRTTELENYRTGELLNWRTTCGTAAHSMVFLSNAHGRVEIRVTI